MDAMCWRNWYIFVVASAKSVPEKVSHVYFSLDGDQKRSSRVSSTQASSEGSSVHASFLDMTHIPKADECSNFNQMSALNCLESTYEREQKVDKAFLGATVRERAESC